METFRLLGDHGESDPYRLQLQSPIDVCGAHRRSSRWGKQPCLESNTPFYDFASFQYDQYDDSIHYWLSNYVNMAVTIISVLLLAVVALHSCCCRENLFRHSNNRSILKAVVACFCLSEIVFVFVDEARFSDVSISALIAIVELTGFRLDIMQDRGSDSPVQLYSAIRMDFAVPRAFVPNGHRGQRRR